MYDQYDESILATEIASIFARKQLNLLPALDLERDFLIGLQQMIPHWHFGRFYDIDEFLKAIFPFLPYSIADSIGLVERRVVSTVSEAGPYIINAGTLTRNPMLTIHLPGTEVSGLSLQDLVNGALTQSDTIEYTINRDEHPQYFEQNNILWSIYEQSIQAQIRTKVIDYSNVVPIFLARRTQLTGSSGKDFRVDRLEIPEILALPLSEDGQIAEYVLVSFAVYHPGHYLAFGKSFPSADWFVYNDDHVYPPQVSEVVNELERHAVMLFYVRKGKSVSTRIPEDVKKLAIANMVVQHARESLAKRIKRITKRARKSEKKKSK